MINRSITVAALLKLLADGQAKWRSGQQRQTDEDGFGSKHDFSTPSPLKTHKTLCSSEAIPDPAGAGGAFSRDTQRARRKFVPSIRLGHRARKDEPAAVKCHAARGGCGGGRPGPCRGALTQLDMPDGERQNSFEKFENSYAIGRVYYCTDHKFEVKGHDVYGLDLPLVVQEKLFYSNAVTWYAGI